jgi:hypothetical protein
MRYLKLCPVMVELRQGREICQRNSRRVRGADETVGVAGVGDYQNFDVLIGNLVDGLTAANEDLAVMHHHIATFHTRSSSAGSGQEGEVGVLEAFYELR